MLRRLIAALALAGLAGLALSPAFAQSGDDDRRRIVIGEPNRYYFELDFGLNFLQDADNTPNNQSLFPADRQTEFDSGGSISAKLGYKWGDNLRLEAEIGTQSNDFDELGDFTQDTTPRVFVGHNFLFHPVTFVDFPDIRTYTVMANIYRDFDIGSRIVPFIGVGGGAAFLNVDDAIMVDDKDTTLAAQARAGFTYPFEGATSLVVNYRLFTTTDPTFADEDGNRFETEYTSHALEIGVRMAF